jgi:dihydroorotase
VDRLLIKNARIIDPANALDKVGDILVADGKIVNIGWCANSIDARKIEASGLIAAPGLVDMHVHLRDPGFPEKEDVITGCKAAAAGGVTSLLCMPNTNPATDCAQVINEIRGKAENADARVYVAAAITKGLRSEQLCDFNELKAAGAIALSDDGRPVLNTALMAEAMCLAPSLGLAVVSHCEDLSLSEGGKLNEGEVSRALGVKGVPAAAEDCGTARELALAAAYGVPVHICHVSTKTSVALIREAKNRGVRVTAETAPHYFALTEAELLGRDADFRMSPPLRTEQDRFAVIAGLMDGTIDAIATDHAPHTVAEKSDFLTAPNGSIGMETSLAAGITYLVRNQLITISQLISLMSAAPAKLLGIDAGTLSIGAPADLVLFDPKECWIVDAAKLHGKSKNAVFKNRELTGKVKMTICRGKIVFMDESLPQNINLEMEKTKWR